MWHTIYNEWGHAIPDNTAFFNELRRDHRITTKVEFLNTDFKEVEGGTIFSSDKTNEVTNFVSDGNIDVDIDRGIRRTAELTLLNPTTEFTPHTDGFQSEGPWVGKVYLNRMVRIWRGIYVGKQSLYVPVGTFFVDGATVMVEQNMSLVNLTLSDRWKAIAKSYSGHDFTWPKNTHYNDIITDILNFGRIELNGRYGAVLDWMGSRDSDDRRTGAKTVIKQGVSRGDRLKELVRKWNLDAYFDPMGVFRTEDRTTERDRSTVWHFYSGPAQNDINGMLVSLQRSFNDDNLYNHVVVIGTGSDKKGVTYTATRVDDNPRSKYNRDLMGDRVKLFESEDIATQNQANRALNRLWNMRVQLSETIEANVIANPALEGDDVVLFTERDHVLVDDRYRLQRFNVPLVTSRQTMQASNIITGEDI